MLRGTIHPRALIIAVAALVLAAPPVAADASEKRPPWRDVYDTERVLEHLGNECAGVPACTVVESPVTVVDARQVHVLAVGCPESHPFVWQWDTEQHEHIYVRVIGSTRTAVTFSIANKADAPGRSRIFVGCSTEGVTSGGKGFQLSRTGVPSRNRTPLRGAPR
jgi:hypothetical protein